MGIQKGRLPQKDAYYTHKVREGSEEEGGKEGEGREGVEGGSSSRLQDSC